MPTRSEVNQSRGCPGHHFDSFKDDPIEICKRLATEVRRVTGCEICLIEIFEAESKSSILFCLETSLPSSVLPFSRFRVREWNPVSCEGEWSRGSFLRPYMVDQISHPSSIRVPMEWLPLHQRLQMQSLFTYPLSIDAQFQSMLGSITLGHRSPGFFMSWNDAMYQNLSSLFNRFAVLAPVTLMKEMSRLVWQLHHSSSVKEQVQFLRSFLTKKTSAISASFALLDQDCNSAELFVDPNDAEDQTQCKPLETVSIKLLDNTAIWNLHFDGKSVGIECNMESNPSSHSLDLDFIYQKKSSTTKAMWILPIRRAASDRNQAPMLQANQGRPVLVLSNNSGNTTSRWSGCLGAVYLHKKGNTDFSDSAKESTCVLIRSLYHLLEKTLRRSEIQPAQDDNAGSSSAPTDLPGLIPGSNDPRVSAEQMNRAKEDARRRVQNYEEDLMKLKIDRLIDDTSANSVVFYGMYNDRPSAVKIVMDASLSKEQTFRTRMEHSILASVDHQNIVRLLGSVVKVSGARVLTTACLGNSREVEDCLRAKWPQPGSLRSIDLSLFILEYCDKGSLEQMIHRERRFENQGYYKKDLMLTLLDISKAMEYLHERGIVHGDLKPANVLIKNCRKDLREWSCCVADFGSSLRRENMSQTSFRGHGCTLAYRAPEIMSLLDLTVRNRFEDQSRADVYSFGMIIYEILEGRVPFAGQSGDSIVRMVRERNRRPNLTSREHSRALVDLMERCWAQDPEQRPSFMEITTELETLLSLEDLAQES